jgi:YidC/Oxa1 family membrane protein insertase
VEPQNPIDKRTVIAFVLMFAVWFGWMAIFSPDREAPVEEQPAASTLATPPPVIVEGEGEQPEVEAPGLSDERVDETTAGGTGWAASDADERGDEIVVSTPLYEARFDPVGGDLVGWELREFDLVDGSPVQLVGRRSTDIGTQHAHALQLVYEDRSLDLRRVAFDADRTRIALDEGSEPQTLTLRARHNDGSELELRYRFTADRYGFDVEARVRSAPSAARFPVSWSVAWPGGIASTEPDSTSEYSEFKATARVGADIHKVKYTDLAKNDPSKGHRTHDGTVSWAAVEGKYFLATVMSPDPALGFVRLSGDGSLGVQTFEARLALRGEREAAVDYTVFLGPIDMDVLRTYDGEPWEAEITKRVDLGPAIFRPVASVTLAGLRLLYHVVPNWGWTIILFSAFTKLLFYPLTKSSTQSMKKMQEIQPQLKKMREKYKDDQQKQSQEMFRLYKEHGVNPMGGCLPLLVQMPVFWALFTVLRKTIDLRQANFALWIDDLSRPDVLFELPFSLPVLGDKFCLLPFLMAIGMWAQTKLSQPTTPQGDGIMAQNAKMMTTVMPVMMFFIFYNSPSGLVLYWLVNTILTAAQTWRIHSQTKPLTIETAEA